MYTTDNIAVAAALKLLGHPLKGIQIHGRHGTFEFTAASTFNIHDDVDAVLKGTETFPALEIHSEIRKLSALLRSMVKE